MGKDEKVNGAKIAAAILNRLPEEAKERLMQAISENDPSIALTLKANLLTFADIATLSGKGVQTLVREVARQDLINSLRDTTVELRSKVLSNVSARMRQEIEDELSIVKVTPREIEASRARVISKLDELRTAGKVTTEGDKDIWV